jgi:hypothetical protein
MQNQINLVQGDTGPDLTVAVYDSASNQPIDLSSAGTTIRLHLRREGDTYVRTITGTKTNGGSDGVATFIWPSGAFDVVGYYEGEVEMDMASGRRQTVPDKMRFYIRAQIG